VKPLGRKSVKFPGKTQDGFVNNGRKVKMWWEAIAPGNKTAEKQAAKKSIENEISDSQETHY